MKKKRIKIPQKIADQLIVEADWTCCICKIPGKGVVLHHIDGDPSNNNIRNLAVLCHEHHAQASKRSGISRTLSPGQLRISMNQWLQIVKTRRALPEHIKSSKLGLEIITEALAVHEIRKIHSDLMEAEWDKKIQFLKLLNPYTDFRYGYNVRTELLETLNHLAGLTRAGMTSEVAYMIENLADSILPIFSLVRPARTKPKGKDIALLRQAVDIGINLAHDGAKYLRNIRIIDRGARILWGVLRFAQLNNLEELKKDTINEFCTLEETAKIKGFSDGKRWLEFLRLDALALDRDKLPTLPADIFKKLLQPESPQN
jgi:hypothetical protein